MEETTPRCDCGLIAGPWANGGAPLAGGRGMVMDRFRTEIVRSFPAQVLPFWRIGRIGDTGVQGFARRDVERKARRIPGRRFRPTLGSVTAQQRLCRRSMHTRQVRVQRHAATPLFNQLSMPCVCPVWHDTTLLSSTYLSQGAVRSRTQDAWDRTAPPVNLLLQPRIVAIQGWEPRRDFSHLGTRAGGTRFGIADSP